MRFAVATALASLAMLAGAATAEAEQRYASPSGSGAACTKQAPCSLEEAVSKVKNGDEVIVEAGTYPVATTIAAPPGSESFEVHGDPGGPMPTITTASTGPPITAFGPGVRLRYLRFVANGELGFGVVCPGKGSLDQVEAMVTGKSSTAISMAEDCSVRDSLALATGNSSTALLASAVSGPVVGHVRNVTAIASAPSETVAVRASEYGLVYGGGYTLDAKNLIARAGTVDLSTTSLGFEPASISVAYSNFETTEKLSAIEEGAGDQHTPPLFVDPGAGDYREAAGSPTIDAGTAEGIGSLDPSGNARVIGAAPDIGAYEFVPPQAPTAAQIQSLAIAPKTFRAAKAGGAILSAKKEHAPVGARVTYSLSGQANAEFSVERKTVGRKVKGKCVKRTKANAAKKKCAIFKPINSIFAQAGQAGQNSFRFSGRIGNKPLKPGAYHLVGAAGGATRQASFRILR
jgi:hypothetical protein